MEPDWYTGALGLLPLSRAQHGDCTGQPRRGGGTGQRAESQRDGTRATDRCPPASSAKPTRILGLFSAITSCLSIPPQTSRASRRHPAPTAASLTLSEWLPGRAGLPTSRHICISTLFKDSFPISVTQSCLTLCDPIDCNMPGFSAHHQLQEFIQTMVH